MATVAIFSNQIDTLLSADEDEFSIGRRQDMLAAAIERYSGDSPDEVTEDITGDGGKYYLTSAIGSWDENFSHVMTIQYPAYAITADNIPQYLDRQDWDDRYYDGITQYLFLPNHNPAATEAIRIKYSAPYTKESNSYATPIQDFHAICHLAAGLCCQAIAVKYSRTSDSTITGDSVDHASRAEMFSQRATELIDEYERHLGLLSEDESGLVERPYGEFVDWDTDTDGRRYLAHGDRRH